MTVKKKADTPEIIEVEGVPVIEVTPPTQKDPPTLQEKLKDFAPKRTRAPRAKRAIKGKQIDANLISKLAPTLVATFVATYSRQLTREPYKVCAPSQQEVMTIIQPLFNILSRSIEITGQASETVIDLITCAIASIIFGTRAYVTYATIKENEQNGKLNGNVGNASPTTSRPGSSGNGTGGISQTNNSSTRQSEQVSPASTDDTTNVGDASSDDAKRDAALFNDLFSRDIEGRMRLGMLPSRVSANNG